ncbi:uncharacterized protein L201_001641 [Kwoniella dendrophila CBS 6074]|uniref:RRM domain-containing protein n=1 Tax=Kwoniella dendrophila CBS 6074 TaxID=1295534 RepID=A0AAX4JN08_9TREE
MSHIPPPPPFLPAPPTFNAFTDAPNQAQGSNSGGGYDPSHAGGAVLNQGGFSRDMYNDRNKRGGGRGGGGGGGRGGRGRDRDRRGGGGDRERSPDRGRGPRRQETRSVEERIEAERICRTLFVRNVSYEADSAALQTSFSTYGEVKTWYDRIKERGIIFVTYFDLRSAQKARDGMHGLKAGDRSIDVHYSLPRDKDLIGDCDREKNQGSILIFVHPPRVVNEFELGRMCEQFGDVKSIKPGREPAEKIVEYFDSRGCALFFDRMNSQPFQGGTLDLRFIWDEKEDALPPPPLLERARIQGHRGGDGPGYGEVRGGRPPPPMQPPPVGGAPGPGYGGPRDPRARSPVRGDRRGSYGSNPPGPGRYGDMPPVVPPGEDRLEQARKVQQLLANLGGPASGNPPPSGNMPPPSRPMPPPTLNGPPPPMNNYPPRDGGYGSGPPPPPGGMGGSFRPPPSQGNFPPYPPSNAGPPPPGAQGYNARPPPPANAYPPPNNNYSNALPPPNQSPYSGPPPTSNAYNAPPPVQSPYNPSTPAPGQSQAYPPYPPPSGRGPPVPGPGPGAYPPPPSAQGYGQNQGGYGYPPSRPPPPPANQNMQTPNINQNQNNGPNRGGGPAKDVGSLLAMLVGQKIQNTWPRS